MKNYTLLLVIFILTACSREITEPILNTEELYFKNNKDAYMNMKREELSSQPKSLQILTIDNYNSTKKLYLFKDKLSRIIKDSIFNHEKSKVIQYAYMNLNEDFFTDPIVYSKIIQQLEQMTKSAKFTDEEVSSIFFTINDLEVDNSLIKLKYNQYLRGHNDFPAFLEGEGGGSTRCNMEWCLTCGLTGGAFNCDTRCQPTLRGCGWFLTQECTQLCK